MSGLTTLLSGVYEDIYFDLIYSTEVDGRKRPSAPRDRMTKKSSHNASINTDSFHQK